MKYRSIRESSWKGTFYATVECSCCGQLLRDTVVYCPHCAHKLRPLPIRIADNKIADALNAATEKEGK